MLDVPNSFLFCFLNKCLKFCASPSQKAGNVAWSKQDWTKQEFHMDELLIISSYYLAWVCALHFY